jgi:hypothetical protein
MACPYFDPVEPRSPALSADTAMLPLGDAWAGICLAAPDRPSHPDDSILRPLCNLGYARGECACFPVADGPDAVRFTITRDDGTSIHIYYVVERDHHPYAHGALEYSSDRDGLLDPPPQATLARQACAYVRSYLRRKSK